MAATKRSTSKNGNAVIIALVAAGLAFASIFTEWGTANISTEEISRNSNSVIEELGGLLIAGLAGGRMIITGESSQPLSSPEQASPEQASPPPIFQNTQHCLVWCLKSSVVSGPRWLFILWSLFSMAGSESESSYFWPELDSVFLLR